MIQLTPEALPSMNDQSKSLDLVRRKMLAKLCALDSTSYIVRVPSKMGYFSKQVSLVRSLDIKPVARTLRSSPWCPGVYSVE